MIDWYTSCSRGGVDEIQTRETLEREKDEERDEEEQRDRSPPMID
jgi:hypothetical protein